MFDRLSRSWRLVKASAAVLRQDKELLLFPLISFFALVVVLAAFALPALRLGLLDGLSGHGATKPEAYVVAFLFYFVQYFVIVFFNSALVGAALMRLRGEEPTFSDGLRIATSKIGVIAGYAALAATVGVILRAIQERVGFIGRIVVGLIGVAWSVATWLVVPVLVASDVGPVDAVKESARLLRKTWGENLIGQIGIGSVFGLIHFLVILGAFVLFFVALVAGGPVAAGVEIVAAILVIGFLALVQSALAGIYEAALYRYATTGEAALGFDPGTLQLAFRPKK